MAALMVLIYHTWNGFDGILLPLKPLARFGWSGVGLFLVLSGFSIHFRWASSDVPHHHFTRRRFYLRRFFRLYPTYLAVIIVSLPLLAFCGVPLLDHVPWVVAHGNVPWWFLILGSVVPLTGNVVPIVNHSVAWSLSLEIQLYVVYSFIVSRLRRIGLVRVVLATLTVALAYRLLSELITTSVSVGTFYPGHAFFWPASEVLFEQVPARAFEWFLGVLAAEAFFGRVTLPRWTRSPAVGLGLLVVAAAIFHRPVGGIVLNGHFFRLSDLVLDPLVGLGYFVLLQSVVTREQVLTSSRSRLRIVFSLLAKVGVFSYSLYLLHMVLLGFGEQLSSDIGLGGNVSTILVWAFVLACAAAFHRVFERPFITGAGDRATLAALRRFRRLWQPRPAAAVEAPAHGG